MLQNGNLPLFYTMHDGWYSRTLHSSTNTEFLHRHTRKLHFLITANNLLQVRCIPVRNIFHTLFLFYNDVAGWYLINGRHIWIFYKLKVIDIEMEVRRYRNRLIIVRIVSPSGPKQRQTKETTMMYCEKVWIFFKHNYVKTRHDLWKLDFTYILCKNVSVGGVFNPVVFLQSWDVI